jgi:hypothetical protein
MTTNTGMYHFTAVSSTNGSSITCSWLFDPELVSLLNAQYIYINIVDSALNNITDREVVIEPGSTSLPVTTKIDGLIIGQKYVFSATVKTVGSGVILYTTDSTECIQSRKPSKPSIVVTQKITDNFCVNLQSMSDASNGYSAITAITVDYINVVTSQLYTKYFQIISPYTVNSNFEVFVGIEDATYNVCVNVENINGLSVSSDSHQVVVGSQPSAPRNLQAYETMATAFNKPSFTSTSTTLNWEIPQYVHPDYPIVSYSIYRNGGLESVLATAVLVAIVPVIAGCMYVDTTALNVGNYTYSVCANSASSLGSMFATCNVAAVIFPVIVSLQHYDQNGSITLTSSLNNCGFTVDNLQFNFYNSAGTIISTLTNGIYDMNTKLTTGSYNVTPLNNGTSYSYTAMITANSASNIPTQYTSAFSNNVQCYPYGLGQAVSNLTVTNLLSNGSPSGYLTCSWAAPATPIAGQNYQVIIKWQFSTGGIWHSSDILSSSATSYDINTNIALGTNYTVVANTVYPSVTVYDSVFTSSVLNISTSPTVTNKQTPFTVPFSVDGLLVNPANSQNQLYYSFTPPSNTGGLPLQPYSIKVETTQNLPVIVTSSYTNGQVEILFPTEEFVRNGKKYLLTVSTVVTMNSVDYGTSSSTEFWTMPEGVNIPDVTNKNDLGKFDGNIHLSWSTPLLQDANRSSYNIYRDNMNNLIGTSTSTTYTDSLAPIGTHHMYQVVSVVNGVSGIHTSSIPSWTSSIAPYQQPAQVTSVSTESKGNIIKASWLKSSNGSGLPNTNLCYKITLTDSTLNQDVYTGDITTSIENVNVEFIHNHVATSDNTKIGVLLISGHGYTVSVLTGLEVISFTFFGLTPAVSSTPLVYAYDVITAPTIISLQSSNTGLFVVWSNPVVPLGLTFEYNTIWYYNSSNIANPSHVNIQKIENDLSYYINSLTNNLTYTVYVTTTYKDNSTVNTVTTNASATFSSIPGPAPSKPTTLRSVALNLNSVKLTWDHDSTVNIYSIFIDGVQYSLHNTNCANENNNSITLTGLTPGKKCDIEVLAEYNAGSGTYSASEPAKTVVTSYTKPDAPTPLSITVSNNQINYTWSPPANSGGANSGGNSQMLYDIQIYLQSDSIYHNSLVLTNGVVMNPNNPISGLTCSFTNLTNGVSYVARILSKFRIAETQTFAESTYAYFSVTIPVSEPGSANFTAIPDGNSRVLLSWILDPDHTLSNYSITRNIYDPTNTYKLAGPTILVNSTVIAQTYTDSAPTTQFLNGNTMRYILDIFYADNTNSMDNIAEAIPYGIPFACDSLGNKIAENMCITTNTSADGTFTTASARFSTNGRHLISITTVGLTSNFLPLVKTDYPLASVLYSNTGSNIIASNQITTIVTTYDDPLKMVDILGIYTNAAGSLSVSSPPGGAFASFNN